MEKPQTRYPPKYVTQQAKDVSGFIPPPFDGSMPVGEFIDWHLKYSEHHPFCILVEDGEQENVPITHGEFARAAHRIGKDIQDAVTDGPANPDGTPKTIALLSGADTLTYFTVMIGVMRAGFEVFPISHRNSEAGLQHLLKASNSHYLVGSTGWDGKPQTALQQSTQHVLNEMKTSHYDITLIPEPHFRDLYPRLALRPVPAYDRGADVERTRLLEPLSTMASYRNADPNTHPCLIMHSSGSTTFPKVIRQNQRAMRFWMNWLWYGEEDVGGTVCCALGLPGFHAGGITFGLGFPIGSGVTMVQFMPSEPVMQATTETTLMGLRKSRCDWCFGVPAFLNEYSNDPEVIKFLASQRGILFGSAPFPEEAGDRLFAGGANLVNIYGATEVGIVTGLSFKNKADWLYSQISPICTHRLQPDDEDGDVYRLVFVANEHYSPNVYNIPGEAAYDTNDVVVPHPIHKSRYRILGRSDDQIMHSTGEKTNPGPLENIIAGSPLVKAAVYFGRERTQAGVLIEPFTPIDVTSEAAIADFRNAIWPYVDRANKFGPTQSRVFKEYILVADPITKPLARTPKGSIARSSVLRQYEDEINQIYSAVNKYHQYDWAKPPSSWNVDSILAFIKRVVNGVMGEGRIGDVDPKQDLFEQGCDSLQATLIRNAIVNALRTQPPALMEGLSRKPRDTARSVPQNAVFKFPSITALALFVSGLIEGGKNDNEYDDHVEAMRSLVQQYSQGWPARSQANGKTCITGKHTAHDHSDLECVLLTGTTGTLGAYLLWSLLSNEKVGKVYAFNRPAATKSIVDRQTEAFKDRGIAVELVGHPKLVLLEGDTAKENLGVHAGLYAELVSSITCIIHNAWRLDFNMGVSSFESHVRGARNLMDLALKSPRETLPRFLFTSSIGTVASWDRQGPVPEVPLEAEFAVGNGYAESKWVVDRIMMEASRNCGLPTVTFRIGQLAGSRLNGAWNTTDWVPHIINAACEINSLPLVEEEEVVSWLPVDAAAASIIEVMHKVRDGNHTFHICHPYPTTWNSVMRQVAAYLGTRGRHIQFEPYSLWLSSLQALEDDPAAIHRVPALKLLNFLRWAIRPHHYEREALGFPIIDTAKTKLLADTLRNLPQLDSSDIQRWMTYWDAHCLFP